jgi:hypothetical protein
MPGEDRADGGRGSLLVQARERALTELLPEPGEVVGVEPVGPQRLSLVAPERVVFLGDRRQAQDLPLGR